MQEAPDIDSSAFDPLTETGRGFEELVIHLFKTLEPDARGLRVDRLRDQDGGVEAFVMTHERDPSASALPVVSDVL